MATILEASLPAEQFALAQTFRQFPDAEFESVRVAASGDERVVPFVRASTAAEGDLPGALEADPSLARVEVLGSADGAASFRVEWASRARDVLRGLLEQDATVLDARGADGQWWFRLLFPDRESVTTTLPVDEDRSVTLDVERIHRLSDPVRDDRVGLTGAQLETVQLAFESGYYEVPRQVTLEDLADDTDVSHQALSERFRRGHAALVEGVLVRGEV